RKAVLAPKMTRLYIYYAENMSGGGKVMEVAEKVGVEMSSLYAFEDPDVSWEWLGEDEDCVEGTGKYLEEV
ncbi:MAG: hypothetical protein Q9228_006955, partial [Teloschistes exilis]